MAHGLTQLLGSSHLPVPAILRRLDDDRVDLQLLDSASRVLLHVGPVYLSELVEWAEGLRDSLAEEAAIRTK